MEWWLFAVICLAVFATLQEKKPKFKTLQDFLFTIAVILVTAGGIIAIIKENM